MNKILKNIKVARIVNRRSGLATNSSSTHSVIYKNKDDIFEDLNIFDERYYDRCLSTIAASREAKIRYILGNCYYVDELVELLEEKYPEIKQYYPMVKEYYEKYDNKWEDEEYNFGDHSRGELFNREDIYLSYKVLCNIIDNPEIVIVGGSDEADFVYDTCEGNERFHMSNFRYMDNIVEKYKNGNYYVIYGQNFGKKEKARLAVEEGTLCPEYPELVDMKITNACEHGCPFCYMNSTKDGKHADLKTIKSIVRGFTNKTEFAIGGGNVLLHPQFPEIVSFIKSCNYKHKHIVNITIRHDDIHRINNKKVIEDAIIEYVDGIGISVQKIEDLKIVEDFAKRMMIEHDKHISIHLIPELLGFQKAEELLFEITAMNGRINSNAKGGQERFYVKPLFLGLKRVGRARNEKGTVFTEEQLNALIRASDWNHCIDTAFINTYKDFYRNWYSGDEEYFVTRNEGEFSMFIDAVTVTGHKSSYDMDEGFPIEFDDDSYWHNASIKKVFAQVRNKCGFKVYESPRRYFE